MSRPSANLRLFVGLYPPVEIAERLIASLRRLDLPPHRLTPLEQVHLTLQFVGDLPSRQLEATIESVKRATGGLTRFSLTPLRLITLPNRNRAPARLAAAETDAPPALLELQRRLATRLARNVRKRPGDRFLAHITLCRFRSPKRMGPLEHDLDLPVFEVDEIRLMRSELKPTGAVHHELIACPLGGN